MGWFNNTLKVMLDSCIKGMALSGFPSPEVVDIIIKEFSETRKVKESLRKVSKSEISKSKHV